MNSDPKGSPVRPAWEQVPRAAEQEEDEGAVPRASLSLPWLLPSGPELPLAFIKQFLFLA